MRESSRIDQFAQSIAEMADVGARAVSSGLALATGGNLSVRGPEPGHFTVTNSGVALDELGADTMTVMSDAGDVLRGGPPSSEWRLHQHLYAARPDVDAVVHLHPEFVVLLDAVGERIRQLSLDHVAYAPTTARIPFHPNGSEELGIAAGDAAASADCIVMAHHGCATVGARPREALRKALNLESAARATYRMLLLGDRTTEFPPDLRATAIHK